MPRHVAVFVQALALLSAGALAIPVYSGVENDDDESWEDVFGRATDDDDYGDVQQLAVGAECAFGDYDGGVVGEDPYDVLAVGVLLGDPGTREVYEDEEDGATAAETFELGDDASYADVYAKLVGWLLQVDREQAREEAERMAASFLDDLTA